MINLRTLEPVKTYRNKCNKLHRDLVNKLVRLQKSEAELRIPNGRSPKELLAKRDLFMKEWLQAQSNYNRFLQKLVRERKSLDERDEEE